MGIHPATGGVVHIRKDPPRRCLAPLAPTCPPPRTCICPQARHAVLGGRGRSLRGHQRGLRRQNAKAENRKLFTTLTVSMGQANCCLIQDHAEPALPHDGSAECIPGCELQASHQRAVRGSQWRVDVLVKLPHLAELKGSPPLTWRWIPQAARREARGKPRKHAKPVPRGTTHHHSRRLRRAQAQAHLVGWSPANHPSASTGMEHWRDPKRGAGCEEEELPIRVRCREGQVRVPAPRDAHVPHLRSRETASNSVLTTSVVTTETSRTNGGEECVFESRTR